MSTSLLFRTLVGVWFLMPFCAFSQTSDSLTRRQLSQQFDRLDSLMTMQKYSEVLSASDSLLTIAKNYPSSDSLYIRALHTRGRSLFFNGKYEESAACHEACLQLKSDKYGEESLAAAVSLTNLGICMYELKKPLKAIELHQKALAIYQKLNKPMLPVLAECWNNLANAQADSGDDAAALKSYDQAANIRRFNEGEKSPGLADLYQNAAGSFVSLNQLDRAIMGYQSAIEIYQKYGVKPVFEANAWYNLGICCQLTGDLEYSLYCQEQALQLRTNKLSKGHPAIITSERALGLTYLKLGDYDRADYVFNSVLNTRRSDANTAKPLIASSLVDVSSVAKHFNAWEKAERSIREAIEIFKAAERPDSNSIGRALGNYGNLLLDMNRLDSALLLHRQSFHYYSKNKAGEQGRANSYVATAKCYLQKQDYARADSLSRLGLQMLNAPAKKNISLLVASLRQLANIHLRQGHFVQADSILNVAFEVMGVNSAQTDSIVWTQAKAPPELVNTFLEKANLYYERAPMENDQLERYKMALSWGEKALYYISLWETKLAASSSLRETRTMARKARETCALAAFHLLNLDAANEQKWLQQIFDYMEGAHNSQLRDAVLEAKSRKSSDKRDSIEIRKYQLLLQIGGTEKQLYLMEQAGVQEPDSQFLQVKNLLFEQKKELDGLRDQNNEVIPQIAKAPAIERLQESLREGQSFLEYLVTDSCTLVFLANKQKAEVLLLPVATSIAKKASQLRQGITGFHTLPEEDSRRDDESYFDKLLNNYIEAAVWFYAHFLEPMAKKGTLDKDLLIVPDAELSLVPFDAFLERKPEKLGDFESYPFLVKSKNIGTAFSATIQLSMGESLHENETPIEPALIMAPFFKGNPEELRKKHKKGTGTRHWPGSLPFSGLEAFSVATTLGKSKVLYGNASTLDAYLQNAPNSSIQHLCSHAVADGRYGRFCYVMFAKGDTSHEKLFVEDIYKLKLRAQLITLSACESAVGELQKEEGLIGLTRAFTFAGARSIVSSLWVINDESTAGLMANFYENLVETNNSKDVALGNAKRTFLENATLSNTIKHPYFWASFNLFGNQEALKQ